MELIQSEVEDIQRQLQQQQQQQQQQPAEEDNKKQEEEEVEEGRGGDFHVLAVDDSHVDRKLLEKLLKVSSYQVTCVDSGDKALEYLGLVDDINSTNDDCDSAALASSSLSHPLQQQASKVNLIMTDYCMPGMSGYDLLKRVKGSYWKDVPVVIMSSENVPSRINMCLEGGADEFLLKPVQLSDLEKLQPYLLKSLNHCENKNSDPIDSEDHDSTKCSNNSIAKRKAMSPEPSNRRPKLKGLAVV